MADKPRDPAKLAPPQIIEIGSRTDVLLAISAAFAYSAFLAFLVAAKLWG